MSKRYENKDLEKALLHLVQNPDKMLVWGEARTEPKEKEPVNNLRMRRALWNARARTVFHHLGVKTHRLTISWSDDGECALVVKPNQ